MPRRLSDAELVFHRTLEVVVGSEPENERRYWSDAEYHAEVYRATSDIVVIAYESAKMKERLNGRGAL